jgi:ABC-type glycerol-3-phosphate transport system substrate-binding protein
LLGAALLTGACTRGNDGPSATSALGSTTTTAPTTTTTVASAEAIEAFRACMIENGVEIEEIPIDGKTSSRSGHGHTRLR